MSTVSFDESILIKSHFEYLYSLKCDQTIRDHILRGYTKEVATKTVTGEHSCNKVQSSPVYQIDNIQFYTCPCNYRHPNMMFFLQATEAYSKGILPFSGSLSEQPSYIMDAIALISTLKTQWEMEQQKKQQNANNERE